MSCFMCDAPADITAERYEVCQPCADDVNAFLVALEAKMLAEIEEE